MRPPRFRTEWARMRQFLPAFGAGGWQRRFGRRFGLAFACLLTAPALLAIYIDPSPRTIIIAALLGGSLFWSALRLVGRPPRAAAAGGYQPTLALRVDELRGEFRRALAWVCLFPVGTFLASLLKFSALSTASMDVVIPRIVEHARRGDPTLGGLLIMLVVMLFFGHRAFRIWRQIRRLEALSAAGPFRPA